YVDKVLPPSPSLESFHDRFEYSVIMTLDDAHELLGDDQINYIRVAPQGISSADLAGLINENITGVDAKTYPDVMRDLKQSLGPMQSAMVLLKYFVLLIAVLSILNTFFMAARERVREVATLKACGAANRVIVEIFLGEALLISFIGSGLGIALSTILLIVMAISTGTISMVKTIPLAPLAMGFLIGMVTGPLAAIAPAIISARQDPIRGLSYE
ncbi:MAG: hypothetical protein C0393_05755, partial [Anaerolinea sp.]|nr:hypothetical protein [Anaerolinea sp.]